ncbi:MAG: transporter [Sphingomonas sp.]|uniref:transporter n=1 Tax=Sphingomonas sp. TaxID=28214 RepID=UPI002273C535|nr:transporter [Sphingomonas sp.]MCX8476217.1 transporter [Sphingomonas sp.]
MKRFLTLACVLFAGTGAAQAQELRSLCPDRPGLGTPACTVDRGHVVAELGVVDWSLDQDDSTRTDSWTMGDLLLRYGVTGDMEVQVGWTALGAVRARDKLAGTISHGSGIGDVTLAVRRNLSHPDGSGFSAAVMPYVTLPTGGATIGAGDWGSGLIVPLSYSLSDSFSIALTPEVDAAVDADRRGRHLAFGGVIGLGAQIGEAVSGALEFQALRDEDPSGHATKKLASLSLAWQPRGDLQLDAGAVAGLNAASPDVELYVGITRRF